MVVVAGAELRLIYISVSARRISLRIHHNGKSTDFEQTLGPGTTINLNALTCCVPVTFILRLSTDASKVASQSLIGAGYVSSPAFYRSCRFLVCAI